jgi:hypothetical protein
MEETSKVNPRIDEQLKHDTASLTHGSGVDARARSELRQQDPVDMPNPADRADVPDPGGSGISLHDADQRAELARVIAPAHFPARRDDLLAVAQAEFAPGVLLGALRSLSPDQEFVNIQAVWAALGGETEGSHS